jgi:hypothetical protein
VPNCNGGALAKKRKLHVGKHILAHECRWRVLAGGSTVREKRARRWRQRCWLAHTEPRCRRRCRADELPLCTQDAGVSIASEVEKEDAGQPLENSL